MRVCVCVCVCKRRNQSSVSDDITTADADAAAILRIHFTLKPFPFFINDDAPCLSFLSFLFLMPRLDGKVSNKMQQQIALLISSSDSHLQPTSTRQTDRLNFKVEFKIEKFLLKFFNKLRHSIECNPPPPSLSRGHNPTRFRDQP